LEPIFTLELFVMFCLKHFLRIVQKRSAGFSLGQAILSHSSTDHQNLCLFLSIIRRYIAVTVRLCQTIWRKELHVYSFQTRNQAYAKNIITTNFTENSQLAHCRVIWQYSS